MKNAIICDSTTMMIVNLLREVEATQPPEADADMPMPMLLLMARRRDEWEQERNATHLMLSARLVALAREQLIEQ